MTSTHCNIGALTRSLGDKLTQLEEEALIIHLSECAACRERLEKLAADDGSWQHVVRVLREETSGEHRLVHNVERSLVPNQPIAGGTSGDEEYDGLKIKPSDFVVDFLQATDKRESLGRLGTIEIREFIGQGAHGIVLKGFQEDLNRLVAVKVIAPHLASVAAARKRFSREAKAAAAILHPNVMPILQVDSSGQLPFLVMPYIDCESLQDRIDRDGGLPLPDVLRIAVQVARGLAAAHAQGLVHRDVKPANILLERGVERVMLTDFGLARAADDATLTRSGLIAGTPHYMSPEQARGETIDARSDLFSLGSVLYTMITGRPPFRAETTYGILRRVTDEAPRSISELTPGVPEWFAAIVMKLLHKSADERFSTAEQVACVLEECLAHSQQPDVFPLPKAVRDLLPKRSERTRWLWVIVTTTVLAAFAAGLVSGFGQYLSGEVPPAEVAESNGQSGEPPGHVGDGLSAPRWSDEQAEQQLEELNSELDQLLLETAP
ncbi:MAG: serine/threonine protein kinase [Planctomyces sp.]|nr:serine/threonine protein kinase [Planctomyces sp.]